MNAGQKPRETAAASNGMVVICREVCKRTGEVAVYEIKQPVDDRLLTVLSIRAQFNPELRYFAVMRCRWESSWQDYIVSALEHGELNDDDIAVIGGIVEL